VLAGEHRRARALPAATGEHHRALCASSAGWSLIKEGAAAGGTDGRRSGCCRVELNRRGGVVGGTRVKKLAQLLDGATNALAGERRRICGSSFAGHAKCMLWMGILWESVLDMKKHCDELYLGSGPFVGVSLKGIGC
jgi:hypothetical protein